MSTTTIVAADQAGLARAAALLRAGDVVAVPTETVYGLAANACSPAAIDRIYEAKRRPRDNPLIVHVARRFDSVDALVAAGFVGPGVTPEQRAVASRLIDEFWPGPLSIVLPRGAGLAAEVSAGTDTVGLRMPASDVLLALLDVLEFPLAAPSANRANRISPTSAGDVVAELGGRIPLVVDGGPTTVGVESTVVRVTAGGDVELLRPGGVPRAELARAVGAQVAEPAGAESAQRSPGRRPVHYAPDKPVILCRADADPTPLVRALPAETRCIGVLWFPRLEETTAEVEPGLPQRWGETLLGLQLRTERAPLGDPGDGRRAAAGLFAALRALDQSDCDALLVELPRDQTGLWPAIADRLTRAAARRSETDG